MLINISWNADHQKGPPSPPIPDETHAKWLWECVEFLATNREVKDDDPLTISATSFKGILHIRAGAERDYLWKCWHIGEFIWDATNPGHQQGCCVAIRMGLEAAGKCGWDYMLHTAEDVIPHPGIITKFRRLLEDGYDYVGQPWGYHDEFLNAQFFGCRVQALVPTFDPGVVHGDQHSEKYLKQLLEGKRIWTEKAQCYEHSHDYKTWKKHLNRIFKK